MTRIYAETEKPIPGFPNYYIGVEGYVINIKTGREMSLSPTMHGDLTVGLMCDTDHGRIQCRRSVKVLVAKAFVPGESDVFDTPILLDGNQENLHAENIMWRPRGFAWHYYRQFPIDEEEVPSWYYNGPIFDIINVIEYPTIFIAAMNRGLLCEDIRMSLLNGSQVFPTGESFSYTNP
jgi:hypothetical protein